MIKWYLRKADETEMILYPYFMDIGLFKEKVLTDKKHQIEKFTKEWVDFVEKRDYDLLEDSKEKI